MDGRKPHDVVTSGVVQTRSHHILLVEDNPADVRLTREAMKEAALSARLSVAGGGDEALDWLRGPDDLPDLILTDLNLPGKDGIELLGEVKSDPELRRIPVIVLTTSKAETHVRRSYERHANCYLSKPAGLNEYVSLFRLIEQFWLSAVRLPS